MDTYRGNLIDTGESGVDQSDYAYGEEEVGREPPPPSIGTDERRMQVRAYNHWASLLDNRNFPSIEDLHPENLPDFGPFSVLLDFTGGIENPGIQYLGDKLAIECGTTDSINALSDVPSRSLLSRITDHYMQILANQAPIGFEAEFVNQRGQTILYRGILLPFSSDDDNIDFIYGVINWKEMADQKTADALLLEIDQALEAQPEMVRREDALTDWADAPTDIPVAPANVGTIDDDVLDLTGMEGHFDDEYGEEEEVDESDSGPAYGSLLSRSVGGFGEGELPVSAAPREPIAFTGTEVVPALETASFEIALPELSEDDMALGDWLASARELAEAAIGCEDRTRHALYAAVGRAYDFAMAAASEPEEFAEILADYGLTVQDRAPMTPVVKLVFGADYDKTRLTEYAAALTHAQRLGMNRGELGLFLTRTPGGLKGVVAAERKLRREESGKVVEVRSTPRDALARKLRKLALHTFEDVPADGSEFTLLIARRMADGSVAVLGEVGDDVSLLERAARKLLG